jgi:salicylate hydroxylase
MTRLLDHWGLGEALSRISIKATQYELIEGICSLFDFKTDVSANELYIGVTGDRLSFFALHDNLINALPGDFVYVQVRRST